MRSYAKHVPRIFLFILVLQLAHFSRAYGQQDAPDVVLHVNVNLVQLDAQVLQKKTGKPIGSLDKQDFELYEDGVLQHITHLSRDQQPLSVVLLFDLTASVQPVLKSLATGALEALQHLKPEDEVAVMTYAGSAHVLQDFTTDRAQAVAAIQKASQMSSNEPAYFNEAVFEASAQLSKAKNPMSRRTIIWLTDNVPNIPFGSVHTEEAALHEVFQTGTMVSAIVERSGLSDAFVVGYSKNPLLAPLRMHNPPGDVYKYAEGTGGEVIKSSKDEISAKLAKLIDDLRTRYTLAYYPSANQPKGKFCEIKLRIRPESEKTEGPLLVKTTKGYFR
jgi:VWFA-related protein